MKKWYNDVEFWKAAFARAIRSTAQGALVGIGEVQLIQSVKWPVCIGTALLMGLLSLLTSIAFGCPEYPEDPERWEE